MSNHLSVFTVIICIIIFSCNQPKLDKELKADIHIKSKDDLNFAGLQYTVENKIVTLSGKIPSAKSHESLLLKIKSIHMIDSINDRLVISPITLDSTYAIKQKVDSVLADYPTVAAELVAGEIILQGKIRGTNLPVLIKALRPVYNHISTRDLLLTNKN